MLRFAPSPTHDMNTEELRVAIFNYIIAKQKDVNFIIRIEDGDKDRNIEGKDTEILQILEKFALPHDSASHQSENLHIHQTLAIRLLEEKKAFVSKEDPSIIYLKKPAADIVTHDLIQGDIVTAPDEVDNFVILRADRTPTYNFACACDDMISGVSLIIREKEQLCNTPKQIHIKHLLGYEQETEYAHLPVLLNAEGKKMSIGDDASTVKWLFEQGFIPDAIVNYLILLGNKVPTEIFTLPEALEWFKLENISKSAAKFDIDKLRFINRKHLEMMDDKNLSSLFGFADADIGKLAKIYLEEASTTNELESKIKPIFAPKDFECEWGEQMRIMEKLILEAPMINSFDEFESYMMKESGLKGENFFKPLRILLTGAHNGPELSDIYPLINPYLLEVAS